MATAQDKDYTLLGILFDGAYTLTQTLEEANNLFQEKCTDKNTNINLNLPEGIQSQLIKELETKPQTDTYNYWKKVIRTPKRSASRLLQFYIGSPTRIISTVYSLSQRKFIPLVMGGISTMAGDPEFITTNALSNLGRVKIN